MRHHHGLFLGVLFFLGFSLICVWCAHADVLAGQRKWTPIGPYGGDRFLVSIHPEDSDVLYAVGHGGVHKSTNGGESWVDIHSQDMRGSFYSFAFHPKDPSHVFTASNGSGVFESADGGARWQKTVDGLPYIVIANGRRRYPAVSSLAFDRKGFLYAGTVLGRLRVNDVTLAHVYRYDTVRRTWMLFDRGLPQRARSLSELSADNRPATALLAVAADGSLWLSLYSHGVYTLVGDRWIGKGLTSAEITFIKPVPKRPEEIYIGTQDDWVFHTTDAGRHWEQLPLPEALKGARVPLVYALAADPNRPDLLWIGCNAYGGSNEQPFFRPFKTQKAPAGQILWFADKGVYRPLHFKMGVYYSPFRTTIDAKSGLYDDKAIGKRSRISYQTGGGTWCVIKVDGARLAPAIEGINGLYLNCMFIDEDGVFLSAAEAGIFVKIPGAEHYVRHSPARNLVYTWAIARDYSRKQAYLYGTGHPAWSWPEVRGIYRLDLNWMGPGRSLSSARPQPILGNTGIWTIRTFKKRPELIYAGSQDRGFLVSRDGGRTFVELNEGLRERNVCCILAEADGTPRFAGTRTSDGDYLRGRHWGPMANENGGLYRFDRKNKRWRPTGISKAVFSLAGASDTLMCATSVGLRVSHDGGHTWEVSGKGLPRALCWDVKGTSGPNPVFYAGVFGHGVFRSLDLGASWQNITYDLNNLAIDELLVDPTNPRRILAATLGGSAFSFVDKPPHSSSQSQIRRQRESGRE